MLIEPLGVQLINIDANTIATDSPQTTRNEALCRPEISARELFPESSVRTMDNRRSSSSP